MKFALIVDYIAINSYYIRNETAYGYDHKPYTYHHSYSPNCFLAMQNLPFLFDEGYFWNWSEWGELPDVDLDFILVEFQKNWDSNGNPRDKLKNIKYLRHKYPNAKIMGWIKEVWIGEPNNLNDPRHIRRIEFLNECDAVITSGLHIFESHPVFNDLKMRVNKQFYFIPQPVHTDYIFQNFYSNSKEFSIFAYLPNPMYRRGETYKFADYISKKYKIPLIIKDENSSRNFFNITQPDFTKLWSKSLFHFNLDPSDFHPGNQIMQVACVGSINIGGVNESHHLLYPETATCDTRILEQKIVEYLESDVKKMEVISYAWNKVNEIYGFANIKNILHEIHKKI